MDKNTLYGLICMCAIFFGFMYCNKPNQTAQQQAAPTTETTTNDNTPAQSVVADSLDAVAMAQLAKAVRTLGTPAADGSIVLQNDEFDLTLVGDALSGSVKADSATFDVHSLCTPDTAAADARAKAIAAVNAVNTRVEKYKGLSQNLGGVDTTAVLENDKIRVTVDSRGGMISSVILKDYMTEVGENPGPIELFRGANDGYSFEFTTEYQRFDTREFNFTPVFENDSTLLMTMSLGKDASWGIRYTLGADSYVVGMEIVQHNASVLLPPSTAAINMKWHQTMARNEKGRTFEERNSAIYYQVLGDSPEDLRADKSDSESLNGHIKWVAFKNQFFSSVIIARNDFNLVDLKSVVLEKDPTYLKDMSMVASVPYNTNDGVAAAFDFYFGPNDYPLLSDLSETLGGDNDLELTRLIPLGWSLFRFINTWIVIPVFTFLSKYLTNYGLIILLLTLFIKLIIFPFTFKSFKSQARMRLLSPEIKAINEKYPGQENAMKRQQETMALYSRTGASPFSGCLPMLLQMPVLIAMFSFFPSAIELRGQSFLWAHDLSAPDVVLTLPFSIPFYGNGVSLFCLLMTIVNVVYMRINMQNQPGGEGMAGMKWMSYLMPVMFLFFFNDYASGLSYYYFLSLLITIVQTWAFRKFMDEDKVRAEMLANAKKPRKKSGFMARLEEAQRQQQAMQRQQAAANKRKR